MYMIHTCITNILISYTSFFSIFTTCFTFFILKLPKKSNSSNLLSSLSIACFILLVYFISSIYTIFTFIDNSLSTLIIFFPLPVSSTHPCIYYVCSTYTSFTNYLLFLNKTIPAIRKKRRLKVRRMESSTLTFDLTKVHTQSMSCHTSIQSSMLLLLFYPSQQNLHQHLISVT